MKLNLQIYMALVLLAIVTAFGTAFGTAIWVTLQLLPTVIHLIESLAR